MSTNPRTGEATTTRPTAEPVGVPQYEIRVRGHLGSRWAAWFDGMALVPGEDGTTVLRGSVVDQAALHGVLQKLRDLGVALLSLTPLEQGASAEPPADPTHQQAPGAPS